MAPGLRPNFSVSIELPIGNRLAEWDPGVWLEGVLVAVDLAESFGILTGIEPGKPRDWCDGKAGGGRFKGSFRGESAADPRYVRGDCIGEDALDEDDEESVPRDGRWAGILGERPIEWTGRCMGDSAAGS